MRALELAPLGLALTVGGCCGTCVLPAPAEKDEQAPAATVTAQAQTSSVAASAAPATKPVEVSLKQLIAAYQADERAADARYQGRRIRTKGYVIELSKGVLANPVALLGPSADTDPLQDMMVQCRVTDAHKPRIAELQVGDLIAVEGDGRGQRLGQLRLEECVILTPSKK